MAAASTVEKPSSKGQAWFCTTGLPSDIIIEIENMSFHLHKFPLMSKSGKLHKLITEQEANPSSFPKDVKQITSELRQEEDDEGGQEKEEDEIEEFHFQIVLSDFPGGSDAFEMAAKFCYGVKIDLTSSNVVPVRCAGEFLEMTQEYSEDNLISKTERFISQYVLKSFSESVKALKSCERVMPLAENLGIVQRCIDSISSRASSADPSVFGWPVSDGVKGARELSRQILWNGIDTGGRRISGPRSTNADSWLEDLTLLSWPLFKRLIFAFRDQDLSSDIIESCLMNYAKKNIPGVSRSHRKESSSSSSSIVTESQQREMLETIIENLPLEISSRMSTPTRFLFGLLRTGYILSASEACRATIEKKIGSQLEQATLDDLLVPSYSYLNETLYDVDCVERILAYFLDEQINKKAAEGEAESHGDVLRSPSSMQVGKLFDGYLSEIASDANIKPDRFYDLATSLPEHARLFDDGLYRAVDLYLKAHPWISEAERQKICEAIDYQKLTLEACTHAAQNERLPLRAIVQVLFFEQLQLRHAIAGSLLTVDTAPADTPTARPSVLQRRERIEGEGEEGEEAEDEAETAVSAPWRATVRENQVLRLDMDSMRTRVHQLERECSSMRKVIEKIDKGRVPQGGGMTWRGSLTRRFGCKFKTQVCDSHEPTVLDTRKGRHHHHD